MCQPRKSSVLLCDRFAELWMSIQEILDFKAGDTLQKIYSIYFEYNLKWTTQISQDENLIKCKICSKLSALFLNHGLED